MNLVIIADDGPANAWLIREVERALHVRLIIRPDWSVPRPTGPANVRASSRVSPLSRVVRALRRQYFAPRERAAAHRLASELFGSEPRPRPTTAVTTVPSWEINGATAQGLIRAAAPDMILVSGAPILAKNIFELSRRGTVNLHFGVSPNYRGMHTLLVPWQCGDYDHLGATLHTVDEGIDSGPVLFRVYPAMTPACDLATIEANLVRQAARALVHFLTTIDAQSASVPLAGRTMEAAGRLVRFHDRTIGSDVRDKIRRLAGERAPVRPEREEIFYRS
jgi:folate-dependent phosphoribosylglycinamide formyltransferase PurN